MRRAGAFLTAVLFLLPLAAHAASGTILTGHTYAWGEKMGWINFAPTGGGLTITDSAITGYAWSDAYGWINFSPTNSGQGVVNDNGHLSGKAWVANLGWLDMSGVVIDAHGQFTGTTGYHDVVGQVTFDCGHCDVATDWLPTVVSHDDASSTTRKSTSGSSGSGNSAPTSGAADAAGKGTTLHEPSASDIAHLLGLSAASASDDNYIERYNDHLTVEPGQHGLLVVTLGALSASIEIPDHVYTEALTFNITPSLIPATTSIAGKYIIGGAYFDITATDAQGNEVHNFLKPLKITLAAPEPMQDQGIGVFYFDTQAQTWTQVPNVAFQKSAAQFSVTHLTRFAILKPIASGSSTATHSGISYASLFLLILAMIAIAFWYSRRRSSR